MPSARVQSLLASMSLEEKVGQMTQVTVDLILQEHDPTKVDPQKLAIAVKEKKVGSILNVLHHAYDLPTWDDLLGQIHARARETPRQIPVLYGIDSIHGANYTQDATLFPHNIGMAASRNDELVAAAARISARETRASGIRWTFAPVLDLGRQPLWSRFEETFGEDSYICARMGSRAIRAFEGEDLSHHTAVASCMKHFIAYSLPASGKDRTPTYIPETQLRELFLPPFEAAIKAGASTLMVNSGDINGIPAHAHAYLLTDVLRGELGFKGLIVSDWEDIIRLHSRHRVAATPKEAVKLAVNAGVDMSMTPFDYDFIDHLTQLVKEGEVALSRIDEAVGRILHLKEKLGLFDNPNPEPEARTNFGLASYQDTALEAARQSLTLVKNHEQVLPLDGPLGGYPKIILAGPCAHNKASLHGSWSFSWQGDKEEHYPAHTQTIREALEEKLGADQVLCLSEPDWESQQNYLLPTSTNFDAVILCLGEEAYAESPGSIDELSLDARQIQLANKAFNTGRPVILILCEGRPRIIRPVVEQAKAILLAYRPGSQGARAIVETIFGDNNPSGVLPFSYPRWSGDHLTYDHKYSDKIQELEPGKIETGAFKPQFPFGHGLSYTHFEYADFELSREEFGPQDTLEVSLTVKNVGKKDGAKVVELYSRDLYASLVPSDRRLRGYERLFLKAGEWKEVRFLVSAHDLSFVNADLKRVTEAGIFELMIGDQVKQVKYLGG